MGGGREPNDWIRMCGGGSYNFNDEDHGRGKKGK